MKLATPMSRSLKKLGTLILAFFLFDCSTANHTNTSIDDRLPNSTDQQTLFYLNQVQPILNKRCVVCHTCTEAPCQLHLDSYQGIRRGATYANLGSSILYSEPTRDKDATTISQWRSKNFFPVIPDPAEATASLASMPPMSDSDASLLYRFVELGHQSNKPGFALTPINEHRERVHTCAPNTTAFEDYAKQFPFAGMPYGLPGLDAAQLKTLKTWIDQGAPAPSAFHTNVLTASTVPEQISEWEESLNATPKSKLMARYIYEHVFSAHIHFKGTPKEEWYELVRSSTPHPETVKEIVTPRPYDNPGVDAVYYRFKRFTRTVARGTHIPWELDNDLLEHYKKLFLGTPWNSTTDNHQTHREPISDPGYNSINPFKYFKQIPAKIRYQFMLENSQLIANAMIRGPACSGRTATHAIRDHFWVFFLQPDSDVTVLNPDISLSEWTPLSELDLKAFAEPSLKYTTAMKKLKPQGFGLNDLWDGNKNDPDALLTIFRHGTHASVHKGLIGGKPPTLWVLNYSNFERIYYNLVADFEPWGSSAHKASTWNYMSRHRSEAEERFISFLPEGHRKKVRFQWTQGLGSAMNISQSQLSKGIKTQVVLADDKNPVESLLALILQQYSQKQVNPDNQTPNWVPNNNYSRTTITSIEDWEKAIVLLANRGELAATRYLPDVTYLRIKDQVFSILNHRFYKFNNILALEKLAYEPHKNRIFALRGLVGDRPEYFADLKEYQLNSFLRDLEAVSLFSDWVRFKNKYFIRRNNPKVWQMSDWYIDWLSVHQPLDAGVIDLREYDSQVDE